MEKTMELLIPPLPVLREQEEAAVAEVALRVVACFGTT